MVKEVKEEVQSLVETVCVCVVFISGPITVTVKLETVIEGPSFLFTFQLLRLTRQLLVSDTTD